MANRLSWVALGIGAYLAFTVSQFPAGTAYRWFAPDALRLAGIEGTVWRGRAALGSIEGLALGDIEWRARALPLAIGRLSGELEARLADGFISAQVNATSAAVELTEVRASTSLPALRTLLPVEGTNGLASVALDMVRLETGWPTEVVGELRLAQLEVTPFIPSGDRALMPLGDYELRFTDTSGQGLAASFRDLGGPLEVSGTLRLDRDRAYAIEAFVRPRPNASSALVQGLEIMAGQPDASNRRRLTLTGTL